MESDYIGSWPGKSPQNPGDQPHPALYHMIDVAAVAEIFLQSSDQPPARRQALILLTALHDLGKIGSAFRDCVLRDLPQINGSHWKVAEALLRHHDAELRTVLGIERQSRRFSLYALCRALWAPAAGLSRRLEPHAEVHWTGKHPR